MKSSPEIIILFIFLSLAFLLERKPLNLILNFVGILISLTFLISIEYPEAQYFSFILIIVYTSALSILFGFIIMLNPNNLKTQSSISPVLGILSSIKDNKLNPTLHSIKNRVSKGLIFSGDKWDRFKIKSISKINPNHLNILILVIFFIGIIISLLIWYYQPQVQGLGIKLILNKLILELNKIIETNWIESPILFNSSSTPKVSWTEFQYIEIIEKTGRNIYSSPNTIINFIIAIFILLLALISLFFLI